MGLLDDFEVAAPAPKVPGPRDPVRLRQESAAASPRVMPPVPTSRWPVPAEDMRAAGADPEQLPGGPTGRELGFDPTLAPLMLGTGGVAPGAQALPWVTRAAISGGAGNALFGAGADIAEGRNPIDFRRRVIDFDVGAVASPALEGVVRLGASAAGAAAKKIGGLLDDWAHPRPAPVDPREAAAISEKTFRAYQANPDAYVEEAMQRFGNDVSADNARELFPEFAASLETRSRHAASVHNASSELTKKWMARVLAEPPRTGNVIVTGGGPGSGKTTGLMNSGLGAQHADMVFDAASGRGTERAIDASLNSGRNVYFVFTLRDPAEAFASSLTRANKSGRTVPLTLAAESHARAPGNALDLIEKFPEAIKDGRLRISVVDNRFGKGMRPPRAEGEEALDLLRSAAHHNQRRQLANEFRTILEDARRSGSIEPRVYAGASAGPVPDHGPDPGLVRAPAGAAGVSAPAAAPGPPAAVAGPPAVATSATPATGGTVPQVARLERFGHPDATPESELIGRTLSALGMDTRRVRTFADMRRAAEGLGLDPEGLLKGAQQRPISDAEVVATANLVNEQAEIHTRAIAALASATTFEEKAALQQAANHSMDLLQRAIKRTVRGGTESGRAVAAFRIIANRNLEPSYWYAQAQRQLGDRPLTAEIKAALDAAIGNGDRLQLAQIVGRLNQPGALEKIEHLVRAMMLSNPGTDVRNVLGNVNFGILEHAKDVPASFFDRLISIASGVRSKLAPSRLQMAEEIRGIRGGLSKAGEVLRHGDTVDRILARHDFNRDVHFNNKALELFTQTIYRRLGAEDALFREPALRGAVAEMAEITAKNQGLRGQAFLTRVRDLIQDPTPEMLKVARLQAEFRTFAQHSNTASALQRWTEANAANRLVGLAVVPFKRTPINIANAVIEYSPFGIPKAAIKYLQERGSTNQLLRQRHFVETLGRSVTGTSLAALGWALQRAGLATGSPPGDQDERAVRKAAQIPNYAIRAGDEWVIVGNNAPLSNILMFGVDAAEQFAREDKNTAEKAGASVAAAAKGLTEQSYLRGVSGAIGALTEPDRRGATFLEGVAGIIVPSLVGAAARGIDPLQREVNNPMEAIQAKVPGWRQGLQPQVRPLGGLREQESGLLSQFFSPVRTQSVDESLPARAAVSSGYAPRLASPSLSLGEGESIALEGDDLTRYRGEMAEAARVAFQEIASDPGFDRLSREEQAAELRKAVVARQKEVREEWRDRAALPPRMRPR